MHQSLFNFLCVVFLLAQPELHSLILSLLLDHSHFRVQINPGSKAGKIQATQLLHWEWPSILDFPCYSRMKYTPGNHGSLVGPESHLLHVVPGIQGLSVIHGILNVLFVVAQLLFFLIYVHLYFSSEDNTLTVRYFDTEASVIQPPDVKS